MGTALHIKTEVLPGHKITLETPELEEGAKVEVFVVGPEPCEPAGRNVLDTIADIHTRIPPGDPEEMDRRWREERDAWDH